jgi:hypothetical protein
MVTYVKFNYPDTFFRPVTNEVPSVLDEIVEPFSGLRPFELEINKPYRFNEPERYVASQGSSSRITQGEMVTYAGAALTAINSIALAFNRQDQYLAKADTYEEQAKVKRREARDIQELTEIKRTIQLNAGEALISKQKAQLAKTGVIGSDPTSQILQSMSEGGILADAYYIRLNGEMSALRKRQESDILLKMAKEQEDAASDALFGGILGTVVSIVGMVLAPYTGGLSMAGAGLVNTAIASGW